jgi:hypothetical protein
MLGICIGICKRNIMEQGRPLGGPQGALGHDEEVDIGVACRASPRAPDKDEPHPPAAEPEPPREVGRERERVV